MRYRIVSDGSHNYALPINASWPNDDAEFEEEGFDIPKDAIRIDGRFTFTDPRCE